jgi:hypothetical protein
MNRGSTHINKKIANNQEDGLLAIFVFGFVMATFFR